MTRTKRLLFIVAAATILAASLPLAASAQTTDAPIRDRATAAEADGVDRLRFAKQRVVRQIERRLGTLERLTAKVESARHISDGHAAVLFSDYATAAAVLDAGIESVNAVETIEQLREVAPPIFEGTLVFKLLKPKTQLVAASDMVAAADERYADVATRLQEELDRLAEHGIEIADAQANLDSAISLVAAAAAAAEPVAEAVINLQPGDEIEEPLATAKEALQGTRRQLAEAKGMTKEVIRFIRSHSSGNADRG